MTIATLFAMLCFIYPLQHPQILGEPALFDILRDAQITNRSQLRSGRADIEVEIVAESHEARIQAKIEWLEENAYLSYKVYDPDGFMEGVKHPVADLDSAPWERQMVTIDRIYGYNEKYNRVTVSDRRKAANMYLDLSPLVTWYRCFPPQGFRTRPWIEMIGPNPAFPQERVESYTINREGTDLIKQVRRNHDGRMTETLFSMSAHGNVVKFLGVGEGKSRWVDYRWRETPEKICVLESLELAEGKTSNLRQADFHYKLRVKSIDINTMVDPSRFTLSSFIADMRPNVKIQDRVSGTSTLTKIPPPRPTDDLSRLAEKVRSRGFAKP